MRVGEGEREGASDEEKKKDEGGEIGVCVWGREAAARCATRTDKEQT